MKSVSFVHLVGYFDFPLPSQLFVVFGLHWILQTECGLFIEYAIFYLFWNDTCTDILYERFIRSYAFHDGHSWPKHWTLTAFLCQNRIIMEQMKVLNKNGIENDNQKLYLHQKSKQLPFLLLAIQFLSPVRFSSTEQLKYIFFARYDSLSLFRFLSFIIIVRMRVWICEWTKKGTGVEKTYWKWDKNVLLKIEQKYCMISFLARLILFGGCCLVFAET